MSFKRLRSMSFPRFSKTDVQRILTSKSKRRSAITVGAKNYEALEPRQLLAADIGVNFTSVNGGSGFTSTANPPNISAAVGENHVVQFLNDGYGIFDKTSTALVETGSLEQFFTAAGANLGGAELTQPRLVFDSGFDRWYVIAVDNQDLNDDLALVQGNRIFLAASNTPDPTAAWKSMVIQPDMGTPDADGDTEFLFGTERINLTVDEVGVTLSAQEFTFDPDAGRVPFGTAVFALPQVALFGGAIETDRLEGTRGNPSDPDAGGFGAEIQLGYDTTIDTQTFPVTSTQSVFGLAIDGDPSGTADENGNTFPVGREGDELILTEFTRDGIPNVELDLQVGETTRISIPFYREPDVIRQPTDIIRDRDSTLLNASVVQEGQFLYAVHAVRGGADNFGANAVLRWYVIDTLAEAPEDFLAQSGQIEAATDDLDFIDPSIDVSPNGTVAIGYTATGVNVNPSSYVSIGVPQAGVGSELLFNDPAELKAGESSFIDQGNQFFGRYTTTTADPFNENRFWTFQQYVDANNDWAIQTTEVGPSDLTPRIDVLPANEDNVIIVQQVGDNIEVTVDGELVGQYSSDNIGMLTVNGNGGMDQFIVDVPDLNAAEISGTYVLLGDGDDTLEVITTSDTAWTFDGLDGTTVNVGGADRISASGMNEFRSGVGNDRFTFPTSNYDFPVFGGEGDDVFVVGQDVTGNLVLRGEAGDDTYNISASSFAGVDFLDSLDAENDQLVSSGTDGVDTIVIDDNSLTINGFVVPFQESSTEFGIETFAVDALADNDIFNILSTTQNVALFGQRGDDTFNVMETSEMMGAAELVIDGGEDINTLNVFQNDSLVPVTVVADVDLITGMSSAAVRFTASDGGSFLEILHGSETRGDVFEIVNVATGNDLKVMGRAADDRFIFQNLVDGTVELIGGAGDDRFETNLVSVFNVVITDSVDAEADVLSVSLTDMDDTIDVDEAGYTFNGSVFIGDIADLNIVGVESVEIDSLDGDDLFNISSATRGFRLLGGAGADRFVINDTAADSGFDVLEIDGGSGVNTMDIQRVEGLPRFAAINETTIDNVAKARISYTATDGSFEGGDGGIAIRGLDTADSFLVFGMLATNSLQLHGVGGNDYYRIATSVAGNVWMDGGVGTDRYVLFLDENQSRSLQVADSGTESTDRDRINFFLTENSDEVTLAGNSLSVMNDTATFDPTIETVEILAGAGDDEIDVQDFAGVNFLRIKGQNGDDTLNVDSTAGIQNVFLIGDAGNDRLNLQSATDGSYVSAAGNAGEDSITVSEDFYATALLNGGDGDDAYDVSFADRGTRRLRIVDSGVGGNDTAIVRGTMAASQLTLRASGITSPSQLIGTTRQLESLELIGTTDRDLITMFAVPVANMSVNTLTGSDILEVNSNNGAENLTFDLGAERDVANIRTTAAGSQTTLIMGRDDDMVNIGSTFAQDNGNLDAIRGALTIDLGQGSDRLQVNDANSAGTHGYTLSDTRIENRDSIRVRPNFASITHSGAEFVNLKGNVQVNTFVVTPSPTVRFLFDGNAPDVNRLTITGNDDGRELVELEEFSGIWLFDSFRDVQFERFINV